MPIYQKYDSRIDGINIVAGQQDYSDFYDALSGLVSALIAQKEFKSATAIALDAIENYPEQSDLYALYAEACIAAGQFDRADRACMQGIGLDAKNPAVYRAYASVGHARGNYEQEAGRLRLLREKFPLFSEAYNQGIQIALDGKDWLQAAAICGKAMKNLPDWHCPCSMPAEASAPLFAWAKAPLNTTHMNRALRRLEVLRELFAARVDPYIEEAKIYLAQRRPHKAEEICKLAIKKFPANARLYEMLIDALDQSNKKEEGLVYARILAGIYSEDRNSLLSLIYERLLRQDAWPLAQELVDRHKNLFPDDCATAKVNFAIALQRDPENAEVYLRECLAAYSRHVILREPLGADARFYLNNLALLARHDQAAADRHKIIMETLLLTRPNPAPPGTWPKKFCLYIFPAGLSYIAIIIRHIPADMIDIIFKGDSYDPDMLKGIGLASYNILPQSELPNYQYILADNICRPPVQKGQTLISFFHGADASGAWNTTNTGAYFVPSQEAAYVGSLRLVGDEYKLLKNLDSTQKCEICYSGPYHIEPERKPKQELRRQVEEQYGFKFDPDRPVVLIIESAYCDLGQLFYAVRHLCQYANVIYKAWSDFETPIFPGDEYLFMVRETNWANNLLRYASDFIMAEYDSGSLISSLMLDLPIIPYYSRLVIDKVPPGQGAHRYEDEIPAQVLLPYRKYFGRHFTYLCRAYLHQHNLLVDVLDSARIRDLIAGGRYPEEFGPHFRILQNEAFGDYLREDAAEYTAAMLLKFVEKGTFGKDCSAILLK